jgi:hypothetical protein
MKSSFLTNLLFSSSITTEGYDFQFISHEERESIVQKILSDSSAAVSEGPSLTLVEIESEGTIYLITQAGHFAHPSILKRELSTKQNPRRIQVSGVTACAPEIMSTWMEQFREQDAQMGPANTLRGS